MTVRPRVRWVHELVRQLLVASVPAVVVLVFPYSAVGYRPAAAVREQVPHAAWVELTAEDEAQLVREARGAWRLNLAATLKLSAFEQELPPLELLPLKLEPAALPAFDAVEYAGGGVPVSQAAAPARALPPLAARPVAATFPRAELLKLPPPALAR